MPKAACPPQLPHQLPICVSAEELMKNHILILDTSVKLLSATCTTEIIFERHLFVEQFMEVKSLSRAVICQISLGCLYIQNDCL
jgi:hypothetical protein